MGVVIDPFLFYEMGQIISRRYRGNGEKDQLRVNISDYGAKGMV